MKTTFSFSNTTFIVKENSFKIQFSSFYFRGEFEIPRMFDIDADPSDIAYPDQYWSDMSFILKHC